MEKVSNEQYELGRQVIWLDRNYIICIRSFDKERILGNDIVIALDGTGIKVANRGEWIRDKRDVRRGYLK